jgi:serine/threonine-protein kinase RsbT
MSNGWSSGSGLGMGLSGAKRLVNEFHIQSSPGSGTRVTITRWR